MKKNVCSIALLLLILLTGQAQAAETPTVSLQSAKEQFGHAITYLSPWLVVGAPGNAYRLDSGKVLIYREISNDTFELITTLSDTGSSEGFGEDVELAANDTNFVLAVGNPGGTSGGKVHIYTNAINGTLWLNRQVISRSTVNFGKRIDLTETRLIGASTDGISIYANASATGIPSFQHHRTFTGPTGINFGNDVAIGFSDVPSPGRIIYAVGAPTYSNEGAVYLLTENYSATPQPVSAVRVINENLNSNDRFGSALDMDGELLIVGAPFLSGPTLSQMGAAFVYKVFHSASDIYGVNKITLWTAFDGNTNRQQANAHFGSSVAIKRYYGNNEIYTAASGAPGMNRGTRLAGAGFVFNALHQNWYHWEVHNPDALPFNAPQEGRSIVLTGAWLQGGQKVITGSPDTGTSRVQVYD